MKILIVDDSADKVALVKALIAPDAAFARTARVRDRDRADDRGGGREPSHGSTGRKQRDEGHAQGGREKVQLGSPAILDLGGLGGEHLIERTHAHAESVDDFLEGRDWLLEQAFRLLP